MRNLSLAVLVLGSIVAMGCDEEKKAEAPAPSSSAATAASAPTPSASAAPKLSMTEMQTASIKLVADAINKHDAKLFASAYAPAGTIKLPGLPDLKGREAIEAQEKKDLAGVPDSKLGFGRVWRKGNVQVAEWVYAGTNTGEWNGQKPSGRPVGINGVSVVVMNDDGLITEERRYFDMPTTMSQMDAKAKAGSFRPAPTVPASTETHVAKDDDATLKTVNAMYTAFESHKVADFLPFIADDAVYEDFTLPGPAKGKKAIGDVVTTYNTAFPDFKQTHDMQIVSDGFVITEGVLTATHKGALGPLKATNKPVTMHFVDIFQVKDAKIVAGWTYVNSLEVLIAVGAAPAPGAAPSASASASAAPAATQPATKASAK